MVARSYGDDNNPAERVLPAHTVCDLNAAYKITGTRVRLVGGINNLFEADDYSRGTGSRLVSAG